MTPADLLSQPAMVPADFIRIVRATLGLQVGYLIIDVVTSTDKDLWVCTPAQNDWFWLPIEALAFVRPVSFSAEMDPRRIVCEVRFVQS